MAMEKKTRGLDDIQTVIDTTYNAMISKDDDADSTADSMDGLVETDDDGEDAADIINKMDDEQPVTDDRQDTDGNEVAAADADIMDMISKMTAADEKKTRDTIVKSGLSDSRSNYSNGMLATLAVIAIIGLVIVVVSLLTSLRYPIPGLNGWNLAIGVFMIAYSFLFLLNWRR
jgi:hypothetical protein